MFHHNCWRTIRSINGSWVLALHLLNMNDLAFLHSTSPSARQPELEISDLTFELEKPDVTDQENTTSLGHFRMLRSLLPAYRLDVFQMRIYEADMRVL